MMTESTSRPQPDVVTFGETMVLLFAEDSGRLRHVTRYSRLLGGAESNVAVALRRLGISTGWFSRLGADEFGALIHNFVRGEGVDVSRVSIDTERPTGVFFKEQPRVPAGQVIYYRSGSAASALGPEQIDADYIGGAQQLHLTGITLALSETCRQAVDYAISIAREKGVRVSLDANIRARMWDLPRWKTELTQRLTKVDDVFLTDREAALLSGQDDLDRTVSFLHDLGIETVVIKHGERGATIDTGSNRIAVQPWPVPQAIQGHGAGDAFAAGVIAARFLGLGPEDGGRLAALLGASATTVSGNIESLPTRSEALDLLNGGRLLTR